MARHWDAVTAKVVAGRKDPKQRVWKTVEPPPIDNSVATYILSVMLQVLRRFHVDIRRPRVGGHTRTGTFTDFEIYNLRGSREGTTRLGNSLYPFTSYRFDHIFASGDTDGRVHSRNPYEQIPESAFDLLSSSFHLSDSPVTYPWLIQSFAARVIFQLSCSNWTVVFAKIRQKIHQFAATTETRENIMDINLIKYTALTRLKLVAIMQGIYLCRQIHISHIALLTICSLILELSSLLISMRREAWKAVAGALRTALRNWARFSPMEAHDIIAEKIRFDGNTERLFDYFLSLNKKDPSYKFTLWPVLVPLLALSPERLVVISEGAFDLHRQRVCNVQQCRLLSC